MSIKDGVQEIFSQRIVFNFKDENNKPYLETQHVFKDENSSVIYYEFKSEIFLLDVCWYKNIGELKAEIRAFLQCKINETYKLVSIVDYMDSNILDAKDLRDILTILKIHFKEQKNDNSNQFIIIF